MTQSAALRAGDLVGGRFEIERLVAHGGMGVVYRALDRAQGGDAVALKVMDLPVPGPLHDQRFEREAELLATLRHPHVVRHVAHGAEPGGTHWLAMEWLEGEDLAARLERGAIGLAEALAIARGIAAALALAHGRGIVHRDIKPSNVFLAGGRADQVRVLDFGIARSLGGGRRPITRTGLVVGTPGYMAPEQARGERHVDARADVFSLGCVLFDCVAGRPAFLGEHPVAVLAKILLEEAPRVSELREVPRPLDELIARMLSKDATARPADGAAVLAALDDLGEVPDSPPSVASWRPSLGATEQRMVSMVVAGAFGTPPQDWAHAPTMQSSDGGDELEQALAPFGAEVERLADGTVIATLVGAGAATDRAAQAARCALRLRELLPAAPMVLATGRGVVAGRLPVGDVIDRAARMIAAETVDETATGTHGRAIRLDPATAGLLDARFDVGGDASGLELRGLRAVVESGRTLLGRVTPCVGRARELSVLQGIHDECVQEPVARVVVVTGNPGVGKSRLRWEVVRKIRERSLPVEIWIARGDPVGAGSPFGMLAQLVRSVAAIVEGEPLAVRQQKLRARVSRHVAAAQVARVTEFLAELVGARFPDGTSDALHAARADGQLMGDQIRRAFEDFLAAELEAQPVVIVLEDLHWGDAPTVRAIDSALRNRADSPLLVLAFARPEIHDLFPQLWADRGPTQLPVLELTRKASEKLVREVLGEGAHPILVEKIVARGNGNPFYLEELMRAVSTGRSGDSLPETVLAMVHARLEALESDQRRVLRAGSVFGQVFWAGGVRALVGGAGETLQAALEQLVEREILAARGAGRLAGEDEYIFRHAILREAAYQMLTDADSQLGHRLAGEWLERAGEADPVVLAEHFEAGGEPLRAAPFWLRAAERAYEGNDLETAVSHAERGVRCGAEGRLLAELRLLQGTARNWQGRYADGRERAVEACAAAEPGTTPWLRARVEALSATARLGDRDDLERQARLLLESPMVPGTEGPRAEALGRAAVFLLFMGLDALAEELVPERPSALAVLRAHSQNWIHVVGAFRARRRGDFGEFVRLAHAVVDYYDGAGNERAAAMNRGNLAAAYAETGLYAESEAVAREMLRTAERLGIDNAVAFASNSLGTSLVPTGRLAEARRHLERAYAIYSAHGHARMRGGTLYDLARIEMMEGRLDSAQKLAREAVDILEVAPPMRSDALAVMAMIQLARGDAAGALSSAREAWLLLSAGLTEGSSGEIRCVYAEALRAAGETEEARRAAAVSRDHLLATAEKLGSPEWKRAYLAIPAHARLLDLCREWGIGG